MFKKAALILASLSITACATAPELRFKSTEEISDRLIEKDKATIERQLGQPRSIAQEGPHTWVWTYHSDMMPNKSPNQGKCELVITFDDDKPIKAVVNSTEYSPFVQELQTCNDLVQQLQ